jgi:hypothetical protein
MLVAFPDEECSLGIVGGHGNRAVVLVRAEG